MKSILRKRQKASKITSNPEFVGKWKTTLSTDPKTIKLWSIEAHNYRLKQRVEANITEKKAKYYINYSMPDVGKPIFISSVYGVEDDPLNCRLDFDGEHYLAKITDTYIEIKIDIAFRSKEWRKAVLKKVLTIC